MHVEHRYSNDGLMQPAETGLVVVKHQPLSRNGLAVTRASRARGTVEHESPLWASLCLAGVDTKERFSAECECQQLHQQKAFCSHKHLHHLWIPAMTVIHGWCGIL